MKFLALLGVLLMIFLVGQMDIQDEKEKEAHYCTMVSEGMWPDFKKGEIDCD